MANIDNQLGSESNISIPSELAGKDLGEPSRQEQDGSSVGLVAVPEHLKSKRVEHVDKYAKHLHSYIREYISTADRKAAFVLTIGAGLLVYLYEKNFSSLWIKNIGLWTLNELLVFFAIMGLGVSCLLSIMVVVPFLKGSKRGLIFWESISEFDSSVEFTKELFKLSDSQLTEEIIKHSYELARVCKRKYQLLNWSLRIGAFGAICTMLFFAIG